MNAKTSSPVFQPPLATAQLLCALTVERCQRLVRSIEAGRAARESKVQP